MNMNEQRTRRWLHALLGKRFGYEKNAISSSAGYWDRAISRSGSWEEYGQSLLLSSQCVFLPPSLNKRVWTIRTLPRARMQAKPSDWRSRTLAEEDSDSDQDQYKSLVWWDKDWTLCQEKRIMLEETIYNSGWCDQRHRENDGSFQPQKLNH